MRSGNKTLIRVIAASTLLIGVYTGLLVYAAYAYFHDSVEIPGNKLEAGTLQVGLYLTESADRAYDPALGEYAEKTNAARRDLKEDRNPVLTLANAQPGDSGRRVFEVSSLESTLAFACEIRFRIADAGLAEALTLTLALPDGSERVFAAGQAPESVRLGVLTPGGDGPSALSFALRYEIDGGAGNACQGKSVTVDFTVYAEQIHP